MVSQLPSPLLLIVVFVTVVNLAILLKLILLRYENKYLDIQEHEDTNYEDRLAEDIIWYTDTMLFVNGITIILLIRLVLGGAIK